MSDAIREHIEIVEGAGGPKARIAGHRIRVQDVALSHEKLGMSPQQIVAEYPSITLADVYAALAYYQDHRDEIEREIADDEAFVAEFQRRHPGRLQDKLGHGRSD